MEMAKLMLCVSQMMEASGSMKLKMWIISMNQELFGMMKLLGFVPIIQNGYMNSYFSAS